MHTNQATGNQFNHLVNESTRVNRDGAIESGPLAGIKVPKQFLSDCNARGHRYIMNTAAFAQNLKEINTVDDASLRTYMVNKFQTFIAKNQGRIESDLKSASGQTVTNNYRQEFKAEFSSSNADIDSAQLNRTLDVVFPKDTNMDYLI